MHYEIILNLENKYAHTAANARHLVRVMPRSVPGMQRLIAASLDISPQPELQDVRTDFFGNLTHIIEYREDHAEFAIRLRAHVDRQFAPPSLDFATPLAAMATELAIWQDLGPDSPLHFLAPSPRVSDLGPFRAFAADALTPGMSACAAMRAVAAAVHARMTFDDEATDVDTTPIEAFRLGRGVCQDYAQITIACLRALGIPAAYVSGFLRTIPPPGKERLPGSDAMHAWVRAWCGAGIGWQEYDPTNALEIGDDHILVGYGRDYADVAPIRGVTRTAGGQKGKHTVDVIPMG